ncbi:hypothetical protein JUJ52_02970 [Virgibacillus sp. AGTR]|uniref:hypothetical protein n=1 Tax=Virgibacillus sp. AGTR TaxID=2812055 RepID=UPI001D162B7F|nr:hypothetical protein [Virgibacillus sp. AGTR]MCC2248919.1 hypothetical protein [Virgibacillus sp. AGTR]
MPLISGLLYSLPYENLQSIKHAKSYDAQHKTPSERNLFGYTAIKLEEDVTFYVGWRPDDMKEYRAKKGEYLVQCPMQPPNIIKSWTELRMKYHVFQNKPQ